MFLQQNIFLRMYRSMGHIEFRDHDSLACNAVVMFSLLKLRMLEYFYDGMSGDVFKFAE